MDGVEKGGCCEEGEGMHRRLGVHALEAPRVSSLRAKERVKGREEETEGDAKKKGKDTMMPAKSRTAGAGGAGGGECPVACGKWGA